MFTRTTASSHSYSIFDCSPTGRRPPATDATKWRRSTIEVAPNCPRCASTNTKFCYYNNYSLSQPRYFCKACRRYWTKGGSLRNVPVGGGCRKSRRARSSRAGQISISDPSPDARPESTPCIDLAAVFAKYVSPSAEGDEPSISPVPSSGSSENHCQIEGGGSIFECHREVALMDGSFVLADQFPAAQEMDGGDFAALDPIELRHGLIGGDLAETTLWPSEVTNFPDFGTEVQPGMQFPDIGLFSGEDHFRVSPGDNWVPFDMPGCEPFCNPCYI